MASPSSSIVSGRRGPTIRIAGQGMAVRYLGGSIMGNADDTNLVASQGLNKTLGVEVREATPERVVATMEVTPALYQPYGYLHGGANVALAETVASLGGFLNCPPGKTAFGLEINANHLRPVRAGTLTATGAPLHRGRTSQVWDVKIRDERERLICVARCTVAIVSIEGGEGA